MQRLTWDKKTRFRLTISVCGLLFILAFGTLYFGKEEVTMRCIEGVIAITVTYITGETATKYNIIKHRPEMADERQTKQYINEQDNIQ